MTCLCSLVRCMLKPVVTRTDCINSEQNRLRQRCWDAFMAAQGLTLFLFRSLPVVLVHPTTHSTDSLLHNGIIRPSDVCQSVSVLWRA